MKTTTSKTLSLTTTSLLVKKIKKPKVSTLRNKCDKLFQTLGGLMYDKCYCGKPLSALHHHHPKSTSSALRYEIKNGIPVCAGCHIRYHAANDPNIYFGMKLFMEQEWGNDWEIELRQQRIANQYIKTDAWYYKGVIDKLETMIKAFK